MWECREYVTMETDLMVSETKRILAHEHSMMTMNPLAACTGQEGEGGREGRVIPNQKTLGTSCHTPGTAIIGIHRFNSNDPQKEGQPH